MGNKKSKPSDHVAFSTPAGPVPNIIVTSPTPLVSPDSPRPFVPPNTPSGSTDVSSGETIILAGTPPPDRPPPPPPVDEDYSEVFDKYSSIARFDSAPPLPSHPPPPIPSSRPPVASPRSEAPTIKRNIIYAKDRIAQFEALNTTNRKKENGDTGYYSIKNSTPSRFKPISSTPVASIVSPTTATSTLRSSTVRSTALSGPNECKLLDDYPIYNPVSDFSFKSGMNFQQTAYPIEANRINIGFCGRQGAGKSTLINALRGISLGDSQSAGRNPCDSMEPFRRHNVASFTAIFVLIDGVPSDEDLAFSKIAHRRNASVVFLSSKSDKKLAWRSRSDEIPVCDLLKQRFVDKGLARFDRCLGQNAPELCGRVHAFFVSAPVFRAIRTGETRAMQYILHERAVFDFLKQKRIIADLLDSPGDLKEGLYANVNLDTAGADIH